MSSSRDPNQSTDEEKGNGGKSEQPRGFDGELLTRIPNELRIPDVGYRKVAGVMAKQPSVAIFRKFGQLNMLSLLSLQAEIQDLQVEYINICNQQDDNQNYAIAAYTFPGIGEPSAFRATERQRQLLGIIRQRLTEYNALLLQVADLNKLQKPEKETRECFQTWIAYSDELKRKPKAAAASPILSSQSKGDNRQFLRGAEFYIWNEVDDLITLRPKSEDPFQNSLTNFFLRFYHPIMGWSQRSEVTKDHLVAEYSESWLIRLSGIFVILGSAALPGVSILVLYTVHSTLKRIYVLIGLTVGFAILTRVLTTARSIEVFAATAAFVAVEVVFVGSPYKN